MEWKLKNGNQVSMKLSLTHKHISGGSTISEKSILTAAHCFEWDELYFGASDIINDGIDMNLEKIIIHPSFDMKKLTNDIAILKTIEMVKWMSYSADGVDPT